MNGRMIWRALTLSTILLVLTLLVGGCGLWRPSWLGRATVTGRVLDYRFLPLTGEVRVSMAGVSTTALSDGHFTLTGTPTGPQELTVVAPDHSPYTWRGQIRSGVNKLPDIILDLDAFSVPAYLAVSQPAAPGNQFDLYLGPASGILQNITNTGTFNVGENRFPAWSPVGDWLAFTSSRLDGVAQVYALAAGSDDTPIQLTSQAVGGVAQVYGPAWAPGGDRLAFVGQSDANPWLNHVIVIDFRPENPDLAAPVDITPSLTLPWDSGNLTLSWSPAPGDQRIALTASNPNGAGLYQVAVVRADHPAVDPGDVLWLTNEEVYHGEPVFSPDGLRIAYIKSTFEGTEIWVMRADDGSQKELLIETPYAAWSLQWSPDGQYLGFLTQLDPAGVDVYALRVSDRKLFRVSRGVGLNYYLAPDMRFSWR